MASLVDIKPVIVGKYKPLKLDTIIKRIVAEECVEVRTDYQATTRTWQHKPVFIIKFAPDRLSAQVYTTSKIYDWVDAGTKPHLIRPKGNYPLRFMTGFQPKTRVMQITSVSGRRGTTPVAARVVHHPGTKARNFTKVILRASKRNFQKRLQQEIMKASQ